MAWRWQYAAATPGTELEAGSGSSPFPNQAEAETWLGEQWRELLAGGVDEVVLLEGDRVVYGPMSLREG